MRVNVLEFYVSSVCVCKKRLKILCWVSICLARTLRDSFFIDVRGIYSEIYMNIHTYIYNNVAYTDKDKKSLGTSRLTLFLRKLIMN